MLRTMVAGAAVIGLGFFAVTCGGGSGSPSMDMSGEFANADEQPGDRAGTGHDARVSDAIDDRGPRPEDAPGKPDLFDGLVLADAADAAAPDADAAGGDEDTGPAGMCPGATGPWLDSMCTKFCGQIEKFHFEDIFAPPDECHALCLDVLAEHPDWLANFLCVTMMEQHYFLGNCWWPKPLEPIAGCEAWCTEALACSLAPMFQIPHDACVCQAACNGLFALTGEAAVPLVECATEKLSQECAVEEMMDCFSMPLNCDQACAELAAECPEGTSLKGLYENDGECIDACQDSSEGRNFALQVCVGINGCQDPDMCAGLPDEPLPLCADACAAYKDLCPWASLPDLLCSWACTGAVQAVPGADLEAALECIEELEQCPAQPEAALFGCVAGKCALMCYQATAQCAPGSPASLLFSTPEACNDVCEEFTPFQAQAAGYCMLVGGCEQPEPCLAPPVEPTPGCDVYCDAFLALCPFHPWVNPDNCLPFCTAVTMQMPVLQPEGAPECFAQYAQCPPTPEEAVFTCLAGKCGLMCGLFGECDPGSQYEQVFKSPDACQQTCDAMAYSQAITAGYCLTFAGCDGAAKCAAPPAQPVEGCDTYCDTVLSICPQNGSLSETNCPDACTGFSMAISAADPEDADYCLDVFQSCPEDPAAVVFGCLVEPDSKCVAVCDALAVCGLTTGWACDLFCTGLEKDDYATYEWLTDCLEDADDCDAMKPCVGQ